MNKILVGIDGSEGSEHALNKALTLIDEYGEIILLAVIPSETPIVTLEVKKPKDLYKQAKDYLTDISNNLLDQDYAITTMIKEGEAASVIIDTANDKEVDLVVIGSKGSSKIGWYSLGSVANKVVQYAHRPVMIVR
jgi:nucleotide-binding universal stress UspA family protein